MLFVFHSKYLFADLFYLRKFVLTKRKENEEWQDGLVE